VDLSDHLLCNLPILPDKPPHDTNFNPEDGSSIFLQNVRIHLYDSVIIQKIRIRIQTAMNTSNLMKSSNNIKLHAAGADATCSCNNFHLW
jgi:hypothetical protein